MPSPRRSQKKTTALTAIQAAGSTRAQSLQEKALASHERQRQLEEELRHFQLTDLPAFDAWLESELGAERAEATEWHDKANELQQIFHNAQDAWLSGEANSLDEALEKEWKAFQARAKSKAAQDGDPYSTTGGLPPEEFEELFETFLTGVRGLDPDAMEEAQYQKARADFAASMDRATAGDRLGFEKLLMRTAIDDSTENAREVKAVYRRLAKRLHPDQSGSWDETEKRLWEEASAAYEALNLEELKRIELLLSLQRGEAIPASRKRELQDWAEQLALAVLSLERELSHCRQHLGWGFTKRVRLKPFREKLRKEMAQSIRDDQERVAYYERELAEVLPLRVKRKRSGSRRKNPGGAQ